jgi:hypothetical protein
LAGDSTITSDLLIASLHFRLLSVPAADLPVRPMPATLLCRAVGNLLHRSPGNFRTLSHFPYDGKSPPKVSWAFSTSPFRDDRPSGAIRGSVRARRKNLYYALPKVSKFTTNRAQTRSETPFSRPEMRRGSSPKVARSRNITAWINQMYKYGNGVSAVPLTCAEHNSFREAAGYGCSIPAQKVP